MTEQTDDAPNEILAAVKAHARVAEQAVVEKTKSWKVGRIGLAAGIGSAAVAAAVLFSRRREGKD
ncbi:hypothetical protein [Sphingomonas sp.]|uniref:hypothetical protein n=1 Tax=Sphingomonas sp. TaxID=28214 RepID=UPI002D80C549|nr:hypothetical protein [Sphingomonas sp.]HEU0043489.1 hypothetical protein [Sphingomonas sp.]